MRWIRFAVLLTLVSLLQAGAIKMFAVKGVYPNLFLVLMVFFVVYSKPYDAIITSFVIGFISDISGTGAVGVDMLSFGIVGASLAYLHSVIQISKMSYQALTIFMVSLVSWLIEGGLGQMVNEPVQDFSSLIWISVYSALIGPFLFLPFGWVMGVKMQRY